MIYLPQIITLGNLTIHNLTVGNCLSWAKSGSSYVLVKPFSGCTPTRTTINITMKYDDIIYENPLINMVLQYYIHSAQIKLIQIINVYCLWINKYLIFNIKNKKHLKPTANSVRTFCIRFSLKLPKMQYNFFRFKKTMLFFLPILVWQRFYSLRLFMHNLSILTI